MTRKAFRTWAAFVLIVVGAIFMAASAEAFGITGIGAKIGYLKPENITGTPVYSIHAELEQPGTQFHILPNFALWDQDHVRDLNPNLDVYYHFGPQETVTPYLGAGAGLHFYRFDFGNGVTDNKTDPSFNIFGGVRVPMDKTHWFVEGRYVASKRNEIGAMAGFSYDFNQ